MSIETIDPTLCPLCGSINACVLASGDGDVDVQRCWCFHEHIPAGALEGCQPAYAIEPVFVDVVCNSYASPPTPSYSARRHCVWPDWMHC